MITPAVPSDRGISSSYVSQFVSRSVANALENTTRVISQRCRSSSQQNVSHSYSNPETTFLGVNWEVLGREVTAIGWILSIPKILKVFSDIVVRLAKAATSPLTIDNLVPGMLRHAMFFANKFTQLEVHLINLQTRFHQAKIKYCVVTEGLPLTLKNCISIFREIYFPEGSEYRSLCEKSFKEIFTPYIKNEHYHHVLFARSCTKKIGDFIPLLKGCIPPIEERIEEHRKKGRLITELSDIDIPSLSVSEILDLFKERFGTPHTSAIIEQTLEYEKKLQLENIRLELDNEPDFAELCSKIADRVSRAMKIECDPEHFDPLTTY